MLSSLYDISVEAGEQLILTSLCNTASITLRCDAIQPQAVEGSQFLIHSPTSNRAAAVQNMGLQAGPLLGVRVIAQGTTLPALGSTWVKLEIGRSISGVMTPYRTLGMGFVNQTVPFNWPGPNCNFLPTDGPGHLRTITGSVPAAGANISETVPTGARWRLLTFKYQLVTSGVAGTRISVLTLDDGTNLLNFGGSTSTQSTTSTGVYSLGIEQSWLAPGASNSIAYSLPDTRLGAGYRIRTQTAAIDVGDQYSAIQYSVLEWMTGD